MATPTPATVAKAIVKRTAFTQRLQSKVADNLTPEMLAKLQALTSGK